MPSSNCCFLTTYKFLNPQGCLRRGVRASGPSQERTGESGSEHLWWVRGLILNSILPLLSSFWGYSFALGRGVFFFFFFLMGSNILHLRVVQQRVVVLEFSQKMSAVPSTLPSYATKKLNANKEPFLLSPSRDTLGLVLKSRWLLYILLKLTLGHLGTN